MTEVQTLSIYSRKLSRQFICEIKRQQLASGEVPTAMIGTGDLEVLRKLLPPSQPESIEAFWSDVNAILSWTADRGLEQLIYATPREMLGPFRSLSALRSSLSKMHRTLSSLREDTYLQFALPAAYVLRKAKENLASEADRTSLEDEIAEMLPKASCTASAPMGPNWGGELRRVLVSSQ